MRYQIARPLVKHLIFLREMKKKLDVVKTGVDRDGRMRT